MAENNLTPEEQQILEDAINYGDYVSTSPEVQWLTPSGRDVSFKSKELQSKEFDKTKINQFLSIFLLGKEQPPRVLVNKLFDYFKNIGSNEEPDYAYLEQPEISKDEYIVFLEATTGQSYDTMPKNTKDAIDFMYNSFAVNIPEMNEIAKTISETIPVIEKAAENNFEDYESLNHIKINRLKNTEDYINIYKPNDVRQVLRSDANLYKLSGWSSTPQFKSPKITVYKDGSETKINQSELTQYLQQGWNTSKPIEASQAITEDKITVYRNGEQKEILLSDLSLFEADGWSTTEQEVVVTPTTETVGISNDWNTNGSNIINLNGNRYALFEKGGSFRSAGSEDEFNNILGQGFTPIGNQNPIWLNFAQSENLDDIEIIVSDNLTYDTPTGTSTGNGQRANTETIQFNNIPNEGLLWDVEGSLYIVYKVPGANGEVYDGNPVYLAYEVVGNDLVNAGLLTKGETAPQPNAIVDKTFFDNTSVVAGNTQQLSAEIDNPFVSFVETITEQSQVAPWITDPEMLALIAEAAIEGRTVSDAEWQTTNWYQTHNESEREWLRTYYSDPSTATQLTTDAQIAVANSLQAAGVSNAPEALINWVAGKFVSGEWSQTYTTEQISLFADPYATGKRDESFENYLSSTALTGVDRTTEREREVRELYSKWLGPSLGKLTDNEVADIAGRLRDDPEYQDQLVQSLKQSRLAAFSAYTNPELTYEDIARPWRNLTTSVWGQTADETQGWWQDMVKSNDFASAQTTLREKGLEQDITQVTQDATKALQQGLGQGTVSQLGVNV
mgnify:CR=1 FL=1